MFIRSLIAACATVVLYAATVQTAAAYPVTARSGTTTVTGLFRPLDVDLHIVSGSFFYDPSSPTQQTFAFTGQLNGSFSSSVSSSYVASGTAGNWTLNLGFNTFNANNSIATGPSSSVPILDSNVTDSNESGNTIKLSTNANDRPVGTLVYNGGLIVSSGSLPVDGSDTPQVGDMFLLYAHNAGTVLEMTVDNILNPSYFYLALAQELLHVGPYVSIGANLYALDDGDLVDGGGVTRVNEDCEQGTQRCGSVPVSGFSISSVPEPASLALVGLGLVALAWGRRRLSHPSRPV